MEKALITGASSILAAEIASAMSADFQLRLLDEGPVDKEAASNVEWRSGSLLDEAAVEEAVRGVDVVIHTGEPPKDLPAGEPAREEALLDLATRGTHKLYTAAVEAGVRRFVYGSTLEIFRTYPDTVFVSEFHRPLPTPEANSMTRYLGEMTSREFARDLPVTVTTLRLGKMVYEEEVAAENRDLMWLDWRDAARTFRAAAALDRSDQISWCGISSGRHGIYHVCAPTENPKYLVSRAKDLHAPRHTFGWDGGES